MKNNFKDVQSHDFRVSRVCEMFIAGYDTERIARYLGYSRTKVTMDYIKEIAHIKRNQRLQNEGNLVRVCDSSLFENQPVPVAQLDQVPETQVIQPDSHPA